jgi:hypothetical protein
MGNPIVIPHDTLVAGFIVGLFVALVAASVRIDALEADVAQLYRLDRYNRVAAETRAPCGGNSWGHEEQPGPPSAVMAQRIDPDPRHQRGRIPGCVPGPPRRPRSGVGGPVQRAPGARQLAVTFVGLMLIAVSAALLIAGITGQSITAQAAAILTGKKP